MRLLFVSHVHPQSGLVGGLRLWRFAEELSTRQHRVLVLCGGNDAPTDADVGTRLRNHDWRTPFLLAVQGDGDGRFRGGRQDTTAFRRLVNRVRTATALTWHGGVFWRWRRRAEAYFDLIAQEFRPELTFGTFGNLDAVWTARKYAAAYNVPWVLDVKDPMTRFIPRPFWGQVRRRCASAAAVTLNAEVQQELSEPVLGRRGVVVYSGADVAAINDIEASLPTAGGKAFVLSGALYDDISLDEFLSGFTQFLATVPSSQADNVSLIYCGVDQERFRRHLLRHPYLSARVQCLGQVPRRSYLALCHNAVANCYVFSPTTFHHKLLELLAAGRPVIVLPDEHPESIRLAQSVGADLRVCASGSAVAGALLAALESAAAPAHSEARASLGWPRFTDDLEQVFSKALE